MLFAIFVLCLFALYIFLIIRAELKLEAATKLLEVSKNKMEINTQQRRRICNEICRFKREAISEAISLEELECYCDICPLNIMQ